LYPDRDRSESGPAVQQAVYISAQPVVQPATDTCAAAGQDRDGLEKGVLGLRGLLLVEPISSNSSSHDSLSLQFE